jgi:hypothetical protein
MGGTPTTKRWPAVLVVLIVLVVGGLAVSQVTGGKAESKQAAPPAPRASDPRPEELEHEPPEDPGSLDEVVEPPTEGKGFLSVECVPKCSQIWFQRKMLGPSPLDKHPMEPGVHLLTVVHKTSQKVVRVTVKEGELTTRKVFISP